MEPITIRVDEELQAKLDAKRGDEKKSDFYRRILEEYVNTPEITKQDNPITSADKENTLTAAQNDALRSENALLKDEVQHLRLQVETSTRQIDNLHQHLHQEQALHLRTQRLLPEPAVSVPVKPWWKFWQ